MGEPRIHPTAIVSPAAQLGPDVEIGPYAIVGARVRIGAGTSVGAHAVVDGITTVGENNHIFPFASVGLAPQDLKYHGEPSELVIGNGNTIREFATLNPGTEGGGMFTRVGDGNLIMNYVHIAHDCILGSRNILANGAQLGGHVTIQDYVVLGAMAGIHQFVRLGESAMIGAGSMVSLDVPPFCNATGDRARLMGLNSLGLKRRGFSPEVMAAIKNAYRILFQSELRVGEAVEELRREHAGIAEIERLAVFVEQSERGICR